MDCLVTKLKGVVSDNSLLKLNELRFKLKKTDTDGNSIQIGSNGNCILSAISGGTTLSLSDDGVYSSSVSLPANLNTVYIKSDDEVVELSLEDKHKLTRFTADSGYILYDTDMSIFDYAENLSVITFADENCRGTFKPNKGLTVLANYSGGGIILDLQDLFKSNVLENLTILSNNTVKGDTFTPMTGAFRQLQIANNIIKVNLTNSGISYKSFNDLVLGCSGTVNFDLFKESRFKNFTINNNDATVQASGDILNALNLSGAPLGSNNYSLFLYNCYGTDEQTLNKTPESIRVLAFGGKSSRELIPLVWTTASRNYILAISNGHMKSGSAQFIKDMSSLNLAPSSDQGWKKAITFISDDLSKSAADEDGVLQSAISTLQGKGVTVGIKYSDTDADGISLMSAREAIKYGIVYKGNELIVEPADTSKTLIAPANDCTYKEFNSLEEAKAFVSSNGLVKSENE